MNDAHIESLREALALSPDNIPLQLMLADALLQANRLDEAEKEFLGVLRKQSNNKARLGLADVYFRTANYSASNVLLEEALEEEPDNADLLLLHAKALMMEQNIQQAIEVYKKLLRIAPHKNDPDLDERLRMRQFETASEEEEETDEDFIDTRFIQKPEIDFSDVGGMDGVKKEIELKIIRPLEHPELYQAYGKKIGGGILLYGPPGCGKTYLAKATAGQIKARFISVGLNDILDMWVGNSEKNLHDIFELARKNAPCVLFFDEIDALGASRSDMKQSASRHLINQFLQELDGIENNNEGVLILGATNTPWNLDAAFRRPGRFDRILFVPPPDEESREHILRIKLEKKPVAKMDLKSIAKKTEEFSGADIDALIDRAIEQKLEEAFKEGVPKPLEEKDLIQAIKKQKASTKEWFTTAKNYALFANDAGLYDEILHYMKLRK